LVPGTHSDNEIKLKPVADGSGLITQLDEVTKEKCLNFKVNESVSGVKLIELEVNFRSLSSPRVVNDEE
jgi:hypothetical protein